MWHDKRTLRAGFAKATTEFVDLAGGIYNFLLTGKKRVASRANFDVQGFFIGGTCFKNIAAAARYFNRGVCGMNVCLHRRITCAVVVKGGASYLIPWRRRKHEYGLLAGCG